MSKGKSWEWWTSGKPQRTAQVAGARRSQVFKAGSNRPRAEDLDVACSVRRP